MRKNAGRSYPSARPTDAAPAACPQVQRSASSGGRLSDCRGTAMPRRHALSQLATARMPRAHPGPAWRSPLSQVRMGWATRVYFKRRMLERTARRCASPHCRPRARCAPCRAPRTARATSAGPAPPSLSSGNILRRFVRWHGVPDFEPRGAQLPAAMISPRRATPPAARRFPLLLAMPDCTPAVPRSNESGASARKKACYSPVHAQPLLPSPHYTHVASS